MYSDEPHISQLPLKLRRATKIYAEDINGGFKESCLCLGGMSGKVDKMNETSAALGIIGRRSIGEKLQNIQS